MNITKKQSKKKQDHQFSLLIPTWNNLPYLQNCIRSIRLHSSLQHQIVVIINEGKDGTLEWVQTQEDLDYIYSEENLGICIGLNKAAEIATTDYLLYLNDDMYVLPNYDAILLKEVKKVRHNNFMLSATMIEPYDTSNPCVIVSDFGNSIETFNESKLLENYASLIKMTGMEAPGRQTSCI